MKYEEIAILRKIVYTKVLEDNKAKKVCDSFCLSWKSRSPVQKKWFILVKMACFNIFLEKVIFSLMFALTKMRLTKFVLVIKLYTILVDSFKIH